jgi:hypothetical protein
MTNGMPSQASNIRIRTTATRTRSSFRSTDPEQAASPAAGNSEQRKSGRPLRRSRQWIQLTRSSRTAADESGSDAKARSDLGRNEDKDEVAPVTDRRPAGTPPNRTREDPSADCGQDTAGEGAAAPARCSVRDRDPLEFMVELALLPARMTLATVAETLEYSRRVLDAEHSASTRPR